MKLGLVNKLDKRDRILSKKFDDDVMSQMCDVISIFPIYGQFGAIRKLDFLCIVINSNLLCYKN